MDAKDEKVGKVGERGRLNFPQEMIDEIAQEAAKPDPARTCLSPGAHRTGLTAQEPTYDQLIDLFGKIRDGLITHENLRLFLESPDRFREKL